VVKEEKDNKVLGLTEKKLSEKERTPISPSASQEDIRSLETRLSKLEALIASKLQPNTVLLDQEEIGEIKTQVVLPENLSSPYATIRQTEEPKTLCEQERIQLRVIAAQLQEGIKRQDPGRILSAAQRFIAIEEKFGFTSEVVQTPLSATATMADAYWENLALPEICDAVNPREFLDWLRDVATRLLEVIGQRLKGLKQALTPIMMATALFSHNPDGSVEATKFIVQEIRASAGAPMTEQIESMKRVLIHMKEFAKENREISLNGPAQELEVLKRENKVLKEKILEMAM